ncbi:transcription termination factor NusA, partial [Streptococcus thoraltensis]
RLRDAEREILYDEFIDKEEDIMTVIIDRVDQRYVYVNVGRKKAVLYEAEKNPNESYISKESFKVFVNNDEQTKKGYKIYFLLGQPG